VGWLERQVRRAGRVLLFTFEASLRALLAPEPQAA
jgi:hypothetical protein